MLTSIAVPIQIVNLPDIAGQLLSLKDMNNMECNEQGNAYFEFKNMGANTITSLTYTYSVNNGPVHTETWYGNMPSLTTETIQIPDLTST